MKTDPMSLGLEYNSKMDYLRNPSLVQMLYKLVLQLK